MPGQPQLRSIEDIWVASVVTVRPRMIEAGRERFPELLDARLLRMDDGSWLDVVRWSSREAAERAAARDA